VLGESKIAKLRYLKGLERIIRFEELKARISTKNRLDYDEVATAFLY